MRIAGQPSIQLSPGGGKSDRLLSRKRGRIEVGVARSYKIGMLRKHH